MNNPTYSLWTLLPAAVALLNRNYNLICLGSLVNCTYFSALSAFVNSCFAFSSSNEPDWPGLYAFKSISSTFNDCHIKHTQATYLCSTFLRDSAKFFNHDCFWLHRTKTVSHASLKLRRTTRCYLEHPEIIYEGHTNKSPLFILMRAFFASICIRKCSSYSISILGLIESQRPCLFQILYDVHSRFEYLTCVAMHKLCQINNFERIVFL